MKKDYNKLKKSELITIIEVLLSKHPENRQIVDAYPMKKAPDFNAVLKCIEKEMANHTGSALKAYQTYQAFKHKHMGSPELMKLAKEFADYLFEEIDAYSNPPDDIIDLTREVFGDVCRLASSLNQKEEIIALTNTMYTSIDHENIIDAFHDIISYYDLFEVIEGEDKL